MTEREHELLRELIDLRVKNKFLRERVGYLRQDVEAHLVQLTAERDEARAEVERLRALLNGVVGACKYACSRDSHCGLCAIALKGISP